MASRRLNTTISERHWQILTDMADEEFGTQRETLETALDLLESGGEELTPRDLFWIRSSRELGSTITAVHKEIFRELTRSVDNDRMIELAEDLGLPGYQVVFYHQKPLELLELEEVVEGFVTTTDWLNWVDTIDYERLEDSLQIRATHSMGDADYSRLFTSLAAGLFERYGATFEVEDFDHGFFITVYRP